MYEEYMESTCCDGRTVNGNTQLLVFCNREVYDRTIDTVPYASINLLGRCGTRPSR
jgi:hypothetical protein